MEGDLDMAANDFDTYGKEKTPVQADYQTLASGYSPTYTPDQEWDQFMAGISPEWRYRQPLEEMKGRLQARYMLEQPYMESSAKGTSPTFSNFLNLYAQRRADDTNISPTALRQRALQAAKISTMPDTRYQDYFAEQEALGRQQGAIAEWYRRVYGGTNPESAQNRMALAQLLALQRPSGGAYTGDMATAIRNSLYQLRSAHQARNTPGSFLDWYLKTKGITDAGGGAGTGDYQAEGGEEGYGGRQISSVVTPPVVPDSPNIAGLPTQGQVVTRDDVGLPEIGDVTPPSTYVPDPTYVPTQGQVITPPMIPDAPNIAGLPTQVQVVTRGDVGLPEIEYVDVDTVFAPPPVIPNIAGLPTQGQVLPDSPNIAGLPTQGQVVTRDAVGLPEIGTRPPMPTTLSPGYISSDPTYVPPVPQAFPQPTRGEIGLPPIEDVRPMPTTLSPGYIPSDPTYVPSTPSSRSKGTGPITSTYAPNNPSPVAALWGEGGAEGGEEDGPPSTAVTTTGGMKAIRGNQWQVSDYMNAPLQDTSKELSSFEDFVMTYPGQVIEESRAKMTGSDFSELNSLLNGLHSPTLSSSEKQSMLLRIRRLLQEPRGDEEEG